MITWLKGLLKRKEEEPEFDGFELTSYYEDRQSVREDIDTAIYVYEFLEELDGESLAIIQSGMKRDFKRAQKACLEIIFKSIISMNESEDEEEE